MSVFTGRRPLAALGGTSGMELASQRSRGWARRGPWLEARDLGLGVWNRYRTEGWCPELARNNMEKQENTAGSPPSSCALGSHHEALGTLDMGLG